MSGEVLTENNFFWIGCDISENMLNCAKESGIESDLINLDLSCGLPFRQAMFDGIISISVLQWILKDCSEGNDAMKGLNKLFFSAYNSLVLFLNAF